MVYLDVDEHRNLRIEAGKRRISMAELVRQAVRQYSGRGRKKPSDPSEALLGVIALGSSGRSDVADKHDHYLGRALRREHSR